MTDYPTPLAQDIHERLWPEWSEMFLRKNAGYGSAHALLGAKGCFPDMYRKVHKIKTALWDEQPLVGEQPREVLMDLIGHAFMLISLLDDQDPHRGKVLLPGSQAGDGGWEAVGPEAQRAVRDL